MANIVCIMEKADGQNRDRVEALLRLLPQRIVMLDGADGHHDPDLPSGRGGIIAASGSRIGRAT